MKARLYGSYALRVYLPFSGWSRRWRRCFKRARNKHAPFLQATRLPEVSWKDFTDRRAPRIWEHEKKNGNIRISELGILSALARSCEDGSDLFEVGTFDGRTTLNLALNSPSRCRVYTLDLPPELDTKFPLAAGERQMVEKPKPGVRYESYRKIFPAAVDKIHQLLGDSAVFDFTPYAQACSLVFVDGSHAYDYAISDTRAAMKMVKQGGTVIWHDYGIWQGVTNALEELNRTEGYGLSSVRGTSLVYWRRR
jgi:Methyltransferase domain